MKLLRVTPASDHQLSPMLPDIYSLPARRLPDSGKGTPPLSSGLPTPSLVFFSSNSLSGFEFLGIIDHHLHPKNRTVFIAYLQPVLFNTMFDSCSRDSSAPSSVLHI
jgi:hypothetical protein